MTKIIEGFVMKYFPLILCLMFFSMPCLASDDNWHLKKAGNAIKVSQQDTDSGYAITRGSVEVGASIDAIVSLMHDHAACYQWLYSCKQSRLIEQYADGSRLDYAVINSPYLYADRDMYTHTKLSYDRATKTATITISGKASYDAGQSGRVRIKDVRGFWRMTRISENKTAILYQVYNNPQLPPSRYLNNYLAQSVFQTLSNLAVVSKQSRYRDAILKELR